MKWRWLLLVLVVFAALFTIAAYLNELLAQAPPVDNRLPTPYVAPGDPDPNRIPLYPRAHDAQTLFGVSERRTTYLVAAEPKDIEAYYRTELPRLGWLYDSTSRSIDSNRGMLFVYFLSGGNAHYIAGGHATITASIQQGGETKISIRVFGDGIEVPYVP